jgi:hypothetical protein
MKKVILILSLVVFSTVTAISQNYKYENFLNSCEQLTIVDIQKKFQEIKNLQIRIQAKLRERAPDYVYREFIKEQNQWDTEKTPEYKKYLTEQNKDELCRFYYLEFLRVGVTLDTYNEYLYGL